MIALLLLGLGLLLVVGWILAKLCVGNVRHKVCKLPNLDDKTKAIVINLNRHPQRMQKFNMYTSLTDMPLHINRFEGVDAKDLNMAGELDHDILEELLVTEKLGRREEHHQLTRGAVGCWLSHVEAWTQFLEDPHHDQLLVFEDDAIMDPYFWSLVQGMQVPRDFDVVLLGHMCTKCHNHPSKEVMVVKQFFGTHCYIITKKAIRTFLQNTKRITMQIDAAMSEMAQQKLWKVYASTFQLAIQNPQVPSSIQTEQKI